jgi:N-acetylglutamate synthase/N-acetylornithine aminotransferase
MTSHHPVWDPLMKAELDVADVERWGRVLVTMGTSENHIDPVAVFVVGEAVENLAKRLEDRWKAALDAARAEGGR